MTRKDKSRFREAFFREAGENLRTAAALFDSLPDVGTYVKDAEGRFVAMNRKNCEMCGVRDEFAVIGLRSCDLFPAQQAELYMSLDREVLRTGKPLTNNANTHTVDNSPAVSHVCIHPVRSADGSRIIGTACVYHLTRIPEAEIDWHGRIKSITNHINHHLADRIALDDLAKLGNTTPRKLIAAFNQILGTTPAQYVIAMRINKARMLLETTDRPIVDIALACGFCDHSHFVHTFRREQGVTPGDYRRRHRTQP